MVKNGAKVSILDCAREKGEKIASEMGNAAILCMTDVTDEKTVQIAVDNTIKTFGAIHVAVNCARIGTPGKVLSKDGPLPMEIFNRIVQINLMGTMNVIRLAAEKMVNGY